MQDQHTGTANLFQFEPTDIPDFFQRKGAENAKCRKGEDGSIWPRRVIKRRSCCLHSSHFSYFFTPSALAEPVAYEDQQDSQSLCEAAPFPDRAEQRTANHPTGDPICFDLLPMS